MDYPIPDYIGLIALIVLALSVIFNIFVVARLWNNVKAVFTQMFKGGQIADVYRKDGSYYIDVQKPNAGFYEGRDGVYQGTYNGVATGGDYSKIMENESLGVCLTGPTASAIQWLKNSGFTCLGDALNQWNSDYKLMHEEEIYKLDYKVRDEKIKAIEADTTLTKEQKDAQIAALKEKSIERKKINLNEIEKQAREDLITLKFDYLTPYAYALNEVMVWNSQEVGAQNNQAMLKKKELQTREQMANENKGTDPFKWIAIIAIAVAIPAAVYLLINSQGHAAICNCISNAVNATSALKP
jgi:hypothetical protein